MAEAGARHDEIQGRILHEYDGIEEADNRLPNWWVGVLLGSIAFGLAYWMAYHIYAAGPSQRERYEARSAELEALRAERDAKTEVTEGVLVALSQNPEQIAAGAAIFKQNCVPCHEAKGQGKIGPNLTDSRWIHGGDPMSIYHTIQTGVIEKGMPPWGPVLGVIGARQVAAFVLTLKNTNVPGKAPEGDKTDE